MRYIAKPYQTEALKFLLTHKNGALFLGCSLGKTSITLTTLHMLKLHNYPEVEKGKVLIVAPPLAAKATWPDELSKWDHLSGYSIKPIAGTPKKREKVLEERCSYDFLTISADLVYWLVDYYGSKWPFETCIIDELSMFKSYNSRRVKSLSKVRKYMKRVIGLTGTPIPKGHEDLWAEYKIVDNGQSLYPRYSDFKNAFMEPYDTIRCTSATGRERIIDLWRVTPTGTQEIIERIKPITLAMQTSDKIQMPDLVVTDHICTLSDKLLDFQRSFIKQKLALFKDSDEGKAVVPYTDEELEAIVSENRLGDIITVKSAGVLSIKLLQWASGAVYADDGSVIDCHDVKLDMLSNILARLGGERCLIAYWFKSDREKIEERLIKDGYTPHEILTPEDITNWNNGKYQVCLVHPARCGRSLNIQAGGHHLIWYTLCWSLELYQQLIYRLYRQGQTAGTVVIHRILSKGTVDEKVVDILNKRDLTQQELFYATGSGTDEEIRNVVQHFIEDTLHD